MSKMSEKAMSQIKAPFFDQYNSISTAPLLPSFKLAYDTNNINNQAAVWVLPFFVKILVPLTFSSSKRAATYNSSAILSDIITKLLIQETHLPSYPEKENFFYQIL